MPLYDSSGNPRATEPTVAELILLTEKIREYENLVLEANSSSRHRQGCPSVASNASLSRSNTLVGNHVPYGAGQVLVGPNSSANGANGCTNGGGDLRHRGGSVPVPNKCPYSFTSYPPPPPHTHHFTGIQNKE